MMIEMDIVMRCIVRVKRACAGKRKGKIIFETASTHHQGCCHASNFLANEDTKLRYNII